MPSQKYLRLEPHEAINLYHEFISIRENLAAVEQKKNWSKKREGAKVIIVTDIWKWELFTSYVSFLHATRQKRLSGETSFTKRKKLG